MLDAVCSVPLFGFLVLESVGLTESSPNTSSSTNIPKSEIRSGVTGSQCRDSKRKSVAMFVQYKQGSEDYLVWLFFATYLDNYSAYLHTRTSCTAARRYHHSRR